MTNRGFIIVLVGSIVWITLGTAHASQQPNCDTTDTPCREFAGLFNKENYAKLLEQVKPSTAYSSEARYYIGQTYLMLAGRESNTPEQEEQLCKKALEYGATSAYMGLYFIYADNDSKRALDFLRRYIATKPQDAVPYVILGEAELDAKNYQGANEYFREARTTSRGRSANLDWLQFQAAFLSGDYQGAKSLLESALAQGLPEKELLMLTNDPRFQGIEKQPEFQQLAERLPRLRRQPGEGK